MTLQQLAPQYQASAQLITVRIGEINNRIRGSSDPEEIRKLRRRIEELRPMQYQARQLAELTEHYYERGYHRNEYYTI